MAQNGIASNFKYRKIYSWIIEQINNGTFPHNAKLPSEADLCEQFSISRQTVRNALARLNEDGFIYSVKGSGSFVRKRIFQREKKIGVMFTTVSGYICSNIFDGLEGILTANGYSLQLELSHNRTESETRFLKKMCESPISGLIIEATKSNFPSPNAHLYRRLDEMGIPYVFVNSYYNNVPANAVIWDDERIAYKLTKRMIHSGHPNVACIFRFDEMQGARRYLGYARALQENSIEINDKLICWYSIDDDNEGFQRQSLYIDGFLDYVAENCTALICYNDLIASNVINGLRARNIRIPEQVSIVSFDNSDLVQFFGIKDFYSFDHPKEQMGQIAAQMLLNLIQTNDTKSRRVLTIPASKLS